MTTIPLKTGLPIQSSFQSLFLLVGALFLAESGLVLGASIPWLLGQANADDFYYYLVLAQNMAAGLGPTFDGLTVTNGFHPLYLLLLTPLAALPTTNPAFLIKAALLLLLLFHNATGLVIGYSFWRSGRPDIGRLAALLWLLNPWALAITLHGVEAPLAAFFWALVIVQMRDYRRQGQPLSNGRAAGLGLLLALAILARTDGLLLFGALVASELFHAWRRPVARMAILRSTAVVEGVAALLTLPWWWWNWHGFGMIMQVSGKAVFLGLHGFDWQQPAIILPKIQASSSHYLSRILAYNTLPLIGLAFAFWKRRYLQTERRPLIGPLLNQFDYLLLAIAALAGWYVFWLWHIQNWYLLTTVLAVTMMIGALLENLLAGQRDGDVRQMVGLILFLSGLLLIGTALTTGFGFPRQSRGYHLSRWLNQNTATTEVVGAWNSGIIAYFTVNPVVNLDGVVNNEIYHYKVNHRVTGVAELNDYFTRRQIVYLTDYEPIAFPDPQQLGLHLVYESPEYGFKVYRRLETISE